MNRREIDERFCNFPPEFRDAVARFRAAPDPAVIDPLLDAVLRKYLPEAATAGAAGGLPDDFGVESLTLIEVVLDLQDAFGIQLTEDELRGLRNLDEARALLVAKARARADEPSAAP